MARNRDRAKKQKQFYKQNTPKKDCIMERTLSGKSIALDKIKKNEK